MKVGKYYVHLDIKCVMVVVAIKIFNCMPDTRSRTSKGDESE